MVSRIERNIVKEILRECYPKKLHPNENFVMYLVQLQLLNPNWGITENLLTSRSNVQHFVKFIIKQLQTKAVVTLKMQFYFMWSTDHLAEIAENQVNILMNRLQPLKDQIYVTSVPTNEMELDALKRLLVVYAIFLSGLGNPIKEDVFLEGLHALKSIINDEELKEFCTYSKDLKEAQMNDLSRIICGIRLFNKYCDRGGEGIPNLADLFKTAVKFVKEEIQHSLNRVMEKADLLTKMFEKYYILRKNVDNFYLENNFPSHFDKDYVQYCKDQLIHYRQYELFVRKILEYIETLIEKVARIEEDIDSLLSNIFKIVGSRLAVPVAIIFPLFNQLSRLWSNLQQQVILLSRYSTITSNLELYSKSIYFNKNLFEDLVNADTSALQDKLYSEHHDACLASTRLVEIMEEYDETFEFEYLGFCCWRLVETNGALIPGNPLLGIALYENKYYVFSSVEAYKCFSKKPDYYVRSVLALGRKNPQLIHFLLLHDQLQAVSKIKKLVEDKMILTKSESKKVQTEADYVIPPFIDSTAKWNVWDLKREVLLMCNLTKRKTTSTQTVKTFSTNTVKVFTTLPRDKETQTHIDKYTNVPKPSNVIFGLRGRKDNKQFVIDLTQRPS